MWVFGYGSLMWDGWEKKFKGIRYERAKLYHYHRAFNKKSIKNWGAPQNPGPTLGLEPEEGAKCIGCAFEFPDDQCQAVLSYLKEREGLGFKIEKLKVVLKDGRTIRAYTSVNDRTASTYIGNLSLEERARMAINASGTSGNCLDYVLQLHKKLKELGIVDPYVEEFLKVIESIRGVSESR